MMGYAYRSAYEHIVGMRLAEVRLGIETMAPMLPRLRAIRSARIARVLAGGVGIAGAVAMTVLSALDTHGAPTYALLGSGAAAFATYVLARGLVALGGRIARTANLSLRAHLPRLSGQLDADLAAIDASHPFHELGRSVTRLESWSTALPLAAIALLAPLTLHYLFGMLLDPVSVESFSEWIRVSLIIVGHAHLALMALVIVFARKMAKSPREVLASMQIHREWAKAWGITVGVSAVPGVFLLLVPPVLTAITGIAFIPFMFVLMRRRIMMERAMLDLAEETTSLRIAAGSLPAVSALDELEAWNSAEPAALERA